MIRIQDRRGEVVGQRDAAYQFLGLLGGTRQVGGGVGIDTREDRGQLGGNVRGVDGVVVGLGGHDEARRDG